MLCTVALARVLLLARRSDSGQGSMALLGSARGVSIGASIGKTRDTRGVAFVMTGVTGMPDVRTSSAVAGRISWHARR